MVPGAFAFDSVLGVVDYWYQITDSLRAQGAKVYVTNLSSSSHLVPRGEELLRDIKQILALTGARKVHLMAHSQGATAARYVAAILPDRVASVSCFHCMNEGTAFADNVHAFIERYRVLKPFLNFTLSAVFSALEALSGWGSDGDYNSGQRGIQIAEHLLVAAGTESHTRFNQVFPAALPDRNCQQQGDGRDYEAVGGEAVVDGVRFFSYAGVASYTNGRDPLDLALVPIVKLFYPNDHIWDGMVPSCGHPLGQLVAGFLPVSHFDIINQSFGLVESGVDIPSLYLSHANRLKNLGL